MKGLDWIKFAKLYSAFQEYISNNKKSPRIFIIDIFIPMLIGDSHMVDLYYYDT